MIKNCYYVPNIKVKILIPQHFWAQFGPNTKVRFYGYRTTFTLEWNQHIKSVSYCPLSNFLIIYSVPSSKYFICCLASCDSKNEHSRILLTRSSNDSPCIPLKVCEETIDYKSTLSKQQQKFLDWYCILGCMSFKNLK